MEPLFGEWMKSMEVSILRLVSEKGPISPEEAAEVLGTSEKGMMTIMCRMIEEGKIKITGIGAKP
ncbi:MAG TPA: hypothetical protein VGJ94_12885 [Syntrophorhabdaceae bacterium]